MKNLTFLDDHGFHIHVTHVCANLGDSQNVIGEKVIGDYKRLYEVDLCNVLVLANNCNFDSFSLVW